VDGYGIQLPPRGSPKGHTEQAGASSDWLGLGEIGWHDKEKAMHASPLPGRIVKEAQG